MDAVIMAGGKGTRLLSITKDEIPKTMVELLGKPVLEYQIENLKKNNIDHIYISIGHLGEKIQEYFGNGEKFGVVIDYIIENKPLGNAGSLYCLKNRIKSDFILLFGDLIFDVDINLMHQFHKEKNASATLFVHPNSHPSDSDIIIMDQDSKVVSFDSKSNKRNYYYNNCVNAGLYIFSKDILSFVDGPVRMDLEKDIICKVCEQTKSVYAYYSSEYIHDIGVPERLKKTEKHMKMGIVKKRNLSLPQKCIFLDRDGTLNEFAGLVYLHEQFELKKYVVEAIREINNSDYLSIVVTNQPSVARGLCSLETINEIHKKLQTLLGDNHAYLNDILFCPHHPDKGYPEENPLFKKECECRKPKTGMIIAAVEKYNIDLTQSWIIGDTFSDLKTGKNAKLKTILIQNSRLMVEKSDDIYPDLIAKNLLEAVRHIIRK